jgi:hypothetical protein
MGSPNFSSVPKFLSPSFLRVGREGTFTGVRHQVVQLCDKPVSLLHGCYQRTTITDDFRDHVAHILELPVQNRNPTVLPLGADHPDYGAVVRRPDLIESSISGVEMNHANNQIRHQA